MRNSAPIEFHFQNVGPVKTARLELGDLTIIAGRNNTGKTYLAYTLYGFLKMWRLWPRAKHILQPAKNAPDHESNVHKIFEGLFRDGIASFPIDNNTLAAKRADYLQTVSRDFSNDTLPGVFSSQQDDFEGASITAVYNSAGTDEALLADKKFALTETSSVVIKHEPGRVVMEIDKPGSVSSNVGLIYDLILFYGLFLFADLLPVPFILSAERFGISLFHRELDFTKNKLIDLLQKLGDDKNRERFSPFLLIDQATSRYALPIKDNIDYTRAIPDWRRDRSELQDTRPFDEIKHMMDGYYSASGDEIRFMSKVKGRSFNIPLHLASSSVRGLPLLYFYLRHAAKRNHLLMIDEPESHLDTANQIEMARLLARCVQSGLKVLVTTHSDYLIKEINNLVMLGQEFEDRESVLKKLGYKADQALDPASIRAYVAEGGGITRCKVDRFGIDMPVFDKTIDSINAAANELASRLEDASEA